MSITASEPVRCSLKQRTHSHSQATLQTPHVDQVSFSLPSDNINISRKDQRVASFSPRFSNDASEPRPATTIIPSPHLQSHAPPTCLLHLHGISASGQSHFEGNHHPAQSYSTLQTAPTPSAVLVSRRSDTDRLMTVFPF